MSKETDAIIEEMANKLAKVVGEIADGKSSSNQGEKTKDSKPDTKSKISVGREQDPAKVAAKLAAKTEELRLQLRLNEAYFDSAERQETLLDLQQQEQTILDAKKEVAKQIALNDTEANRAAQAALDSELEKLQQILEPHREKLKNLKRMTKAQKELKSITDNYFDSLANKIGLTTDASKTMVGQFLKFGNLLASTGGWSTAFKSLGKAMANLPLSLIDSMVNTTVDMIFGLDKAAAGFSGATGFGQKYRKELLQISTQNLRLGITGEDASKSMQSMLKVLGSTSSMSPSVVKSFAEMGAQLNKIGVAFEDSAKSIQFFTKIANMSATESETVTKRLFQMGAAIDVTAEQMSKDFTATLPKLAVYGSKAEAIFLKLTASAKAAGVGIKSMLDMAGQFDTFQGAAESAGKLNAILGTQISATEMVRMTEEERVETIIQQIQLSGRSFSDLDRYTQKAIAASVGITDMAEANLIFGMSMREYGEHQGKMDAQAADQKKLNDAIKEAQPLMDKLKIAFSQLFVANEEWIMSIMDGTKGLVSWISTHRESIKFWIKAYGVFRIALPLIRGIWAATKLMALWTAKDTIQKAANAAAEQTSNFIKAETVIVNNAVGTSSMFASKGILAVGLALGVAFAGAGALVAGVASLAEALKDMSSDEISNLQYTLVGLATGMFIFSAGIIAIGAAATGPQAVGIQAVAAAVFAVGAAVGMASAGIGVMGMGMAMMAEAGLGAAGALVAVGLAMYGFILGMASVSTIATPVILLTLALGAAFLMVGVATELVGLGMNSIIESLNKAGPSIGATASGFMKLGFAMLLLAGAAYAMGVPPALIGASIMLGMLVAQAASATAVAASAKASADQVKNMSELFSNVSVAKADKVTSAINNITAAILGVDIALGSGKRRMEVLSVFEDIASISSSPASYSKPMSLVSKASSQVTSRYNNNLTRSGGTNSEAKALIKEMRTLISKSPWTSKDKFEINLRIDDGEAFSTTIDDINLKKGRTR